MQAAQIKKADFTIGVLGGMGTYATLNLFQQYAELFPAEKEWERPRIIIDNNCTMPSRVRAILYGEKVDILVEAMTSSIRHLIDAGATHIILGCNTAHVFLDRVYECCPDARKYVINIIDNCVEELKKEEEEHVYLLATEGTILSNVYSSKLERAKIKCEMPLEKDFHLLRECIEAVKQKKYTKQVQETFIDLVGRGRACILGCTELPILYGMHKSSITKTTVYDPLYMALEKIKKCYDNAE